MRPILVGASLHWPRRALQMPATAIRWVSDGHAGLDAMLAGVQAKFPGFVLKRISKVDSHNNAVRFAWSLGPAVGPSVVEGVDFATLSSDGKLASIVGFIDKMPG